MSKAELIANKKESIMFISDAHEKFYYEKLKIKTGCVKTECLHESWQTSGSVKVVRMAFNLYCNGTPSVLDYEDAEERLEKCKQYTVEELFCCGKYGMFRRTFLKIDSNKLIR